MFFLTRYQQYFDIYHYFDTKYDKLHHFLTRIHKAHVADKDFDENVCDIMASYAMILTNDYLHKSDVKTKYKEADAMIVLYSITIIAYWIICKLSMDMYPCLGQINLKFLNLHKKNFLETEFDICKKFGFQMGKYIPGFIEYS